jgi:hypothetical protein
VTRHDRVQLLVLVAVVLANYLAQIPYALDLYGSSWSGRGALLLGVSFVWFAAGVPLLLRGRAAGYWLLLSFVAVELAFYFHNEVLLIPVGYGLPYQLTHARDALLWVVFLIGDVNFVVAGYFLWFLVSRWSPLAGRRPAPR